jgi:hypothetical protein
MTPSRRAVPGKETSDSPSVRFSVLGARCSVLLLPQSQLQEALTGLSQDADKDVSKSRCE